MLSILELSSYLEELLQPHCYKDYCPNGLQVFGRSTVTKIVSGVSANHALFEQAITAKADTILVHHGFFWKNEDPCIIGLKHSRLSMLMKHDINLLAYHLPLDGHDILGNNIQLAKRLHIRPTDEIKITDGPGILRIGELIHPMSGEKFFEHIDHQLSRKPFYIPASTEIKKIAWCTGAAQDFLEKAALKGVDAFLTGEISERTVSIAQELGIHFYAAGHHATERYGVLALGEHLAQKFSIAHQFIDIDNPV